MEVRGRMNDVLLLASKYNIRKIIFVKIGDEYCEANGIDSYINSSYIAGGDIYVGIFRSKEKMLLSVLHELGHRASRRKVKNKYEEETAAWDWAFKFAKKLGYEFGANTIAWAKKSLETYRHYK